MRFSALCVLLASVLALSACSPPPEEVSKLKEQTGQFMAENGKRAGVQTTTSGLQYEVIQPGQGPKPVATSHVTVNYKGMFTNGEVFDQAESAAFPLNGVIAGWTEGLQLMSVGAKYKFYVPPTLGYGEAGAGSVIPPHAALIFEVELLKVEP